MQHVSSDPLISGHPGFNFLLYFNLLKRAFLIKCEKYEYLDTADFIKKVLSVYTHSMQTIYLSPSAQVAKSTLFMKSLV